MKKKTLSTWAIIMVVVFGGIVVLYPMMFNPEENESAPQEPTPVTAPASTNSLNN